LTTAGIAAAIEERSPTGGDTFGAGETAIAGCCGKGVATGTGFSRPKNGSGIGSHTLGATMAAASRIPPRNEIATIPFARASAMPAPAIVSKLVDVEGHGSAATPHNSIDT
jgi:hypothetical protein